MFTVNSSAEPPANATMERRLEHLERQARANGRRQRSLLLALIAVAALQLTGSTRETDLRRGKSTPSPTASLSTGPQSIDAPTIPPSPVSQRGIGVFVGQVRLLSGDGTVRATLSIDDEGTASLSLHDGNGKLRNQLSVCADGKPELSFRGANGDVRLTLNLGDGDMPSMLFNDTNGVRRVSLTTVPPALICANHQGKPRAVFGVGKQGAGVVSVEDVHGRPVPLNGGPGH